MALEAGLAPAFGLPAISQATMLSGILAVLLDLDHIELPPHRTPIAHSLPSAAFWAYISLAAAMALLPAWTACVALAWGCAVGSHLFLDALTRGGIFLWPVGLSIQEWLRPVPDGLLLYQGGRPYLSSDERAHQALADGELAWPGWKRWRVHFPWELIPGKLPADAVVSSMGLLGLVAAAAWG